MDHYPIFEAGESAAAIVPLMEETDILPGDRAVLSAAAAGLELDAALQLLAQRARFLTGASGAVIALRNSGRLVCRASTGRNVPEAGTELDVDSRLEVSADRRLMKPLVREEEALGFVELFADRDFYFAQSDVAVLDRIAQLSVTAWEHAEAAERAIHEIVCVRDEALPTPAMSPAILSEPPQLPDPIPLVLPKFGSCETCGFPVSAGRKLCVDCEEASEPEKSSSLANDNCPEFLSQLADSPDQGWLQVDMYTVGTALVAVLTMILLVLKYR